MMEECELRRNPTWAQVKKIIKLNITVDEHECWVWQRAKDVGGYSRLWGGSGHRLSYQSYVGPIGKGLDIDHLCRNRACVNPKHLEPVTRKENLARGVGIENQKEKARTKTHCFKGHELIGDNLYVRPSDGARMCQICRADNWRKSNESRRNAINERKREWRRKWKEKGFRK